MCADLLGGAGPCDPGPAEEVPCPGYAENGNDERLERAQQRKPEQAAPGPAGQWQPLLVAQQAGKRAAQRPSQQQEGHPQRNGYEQPAASALNKNMK